MISLDVVTLTVAGLMVGNELCVAAFVHPALGRLPDAVHRPAATEIAKVLGRAMPFWYALTLVLTVGVAWCGITQRKFGRGTLWLLRGWFCFRL